MRPGYSICARSQSIRLECLELNGSTSQTELTSRGMALIFFIKLIIKVFDFIIILNKKEFPLLVHGEDRTRNLSVRSRTPYPLGHADRFVGEFFSHHFRFVLGLNQ